MSTVAALIADLVKAGVDPMLVGRVAQAITEAAASADGSLPTWTRAAPAGEERVWVYVIGVDHPGDVLVKVGVSKHPNFRLSTLEKERGYNLYLAHTEGPFSRPDAMRVERKAHEELVAHREVGEWFLCGADRAIDVVRSCATGVPK